MINRGLPFFLRFPYSRVVRKNPVRACKCGPVTFCHVRFWAIHVEFLAVTRCCAWLADLLFGCHRPGPTGGPRRTSSCGEGGRGPLPAKAVGRVSGAEGRASAGRRFHPLDDGGPASMVRWAQRAGERPSRQAPALAPPGIPPLRAMEFEDGGPAALAQEPPGADRRGGGARWRQTIPPGDRNASPTSCS